MDHSFDEFNICALISKPTKDCVRLLRYTTCSVCTTRLSFQLFPQYKYHSSQMRISALIKFLDWSDQHDLKFEIMTNIMLIDMTDPDTQTIKLLTRLCSPTIERRLNFLKFMSNVKDDDRNIPVEVCRKIVENISSVENCIIRSKFGFMFMDCLPPYLLKTIANVSVERCLSTKNEVFYLNKLPYIKLLAFVSILLTDAHFIGREITFACEELDVCLNDGLHFSNIAIRFRFLRYLNINITDGYEDLAQTLQRAKHLNSLKLFVDGEAPMSFYESVIKAVINIQSFEALDISYNHKHKTNEFKLYIT